MPWCPQCDETFPEGPDCPRCTTPLVERATGQPTAEMQQGGSLPRIKVPRRYRRAFERLGRSEPAPKPLITIALAFILFSLGFLLGRMDSISTVSPAIRPLGAVEPFADLGVDGSATYAVLAPAGDPTAALVRQTLSTGELAIRGRADLPVTPSRALRTRITEMHGSVAMQLSDDSTELVGAFPSGRASMAWVEGSVAAWEHTRALVVLDTEGRARRWSFGERTESEDIPGRWSWVFQTPAGAVLEAAGEQRHLAVWSSAGPRRTIEIPRDAKVLAVSSDGRRALVQAQRPGIWDGREVRPLRLAGYEVVAASFSADGERMAVVVDRPTTGGEPSEPALGIVAADGTVALRPIGRLTANCDPVPAWDPEGRFVYVAPGDGSVYAAEVGGGRVEHVRTRVAGCGLAWTE